MREPTAVDDDEEQGELMVADVLPELAGLRLDQALAEIFPDFSRSKLQSWIRSGHVAVDGRRNPSIFRDFQHLRGAHGCLAAPQISQEKGEKEGIPVGLREQYP